MTYWSPTDSTYFGEDVKINSLAFLRKRESFRGKDLVRVEVKVDDVLIAGKVQGERSIRFVSTIGLLINHGRTKVISERCCPKAVGRRVSFGRYAFKMEDNLTIVVAIDDHDQIYE